MEFVGRAAPGSWESLKTNTRPHIPGALDGSESQAGEPNQTVPQVPHMPGPKHIVPPALDELPMPLPVPPAEDVPVPQPPGEQIQPVPSRESITDMRRTLRDIRDNAQVAPVAGQVDEAGRVRL